MNLQDAITATQETAEKSLANDIKRIETMHLARMLLGSMRGVHVSLPTSRWDMLYWTVRVTRDMLPACRNALGVPLKLYGKQPHNDSKTEIEVSLKAEGFDGLTIEYLAELPKPKRKKKGETSEKKPKCKIKRVRIPARYETRLVCEA